MSYIKVDIPSVLSEGLEVIFYAPCDYSKVTGLKVYYTDQTTLEEVSESFTFCDARGNDLSDLDNLFAEGACVKVILSVTEKRAYIQNAVTNSYLENRFKGLEEKSSVTISNNAPSDINGLWIDTTNTGGAVSKYYDKESKSWVTVKATWG